MESKKIANKGQNNVPQQRMHEMSQSAGLSTPVFDSKNSNIMSTGADVQRVHYLTLLEALSKITENTLSFSDWSINAN